MRLHQKGIWMTTQDETAVRHDAEEIVRARLLEPFHAGGLSLANRVVMAPMTRNMAPDGVVTEDSARYYARRAAGGVGLIVSEGTWIADDAASHRDDVPRFYGDDALAGWKRVVEAVHRAGGRMFPQLWHVGMVRRPTDRAFSPASLPIGPSGVSYDPERGEYLQTGAEMTQARIDSVIDAYAAAALSAKELGFDGVELHGAHGYLIDQFLWHVTNRRTDGYGGDMANRVRFAVEIVAECRRRVGPDFPISLRFSDWKVDDYEARLAETPDELAAMIEPLAAAGVDMFHCSTRRCWEPRFAGSELTLAGWTRKISGKTTICVGSIGLSKRFDSKAERKDQALEFPPAPLGQMAAMTGRGEYDLAAVGRMLIANPDWASLLASGAQDGLRTYTPRMRSTLE